MPMAMRKVRAGSLPPNTPVFAAVDDVAADDFAHVSPAKDVLVTVKNEVNMVLWRKLWVLATKIADACDYLHDKNDAMDLILIGCRWVRWVHNPRTGLSFPVAKSISGIEGDVFLRLYNRAIYYVTTEILPGLPESTLRDEIERMVAPPFGQVA